MIKNKMVEIKDGDKTHCFRLYQLPAMRSFEIKIKAGIILARSNLSLEEIAKSFDDGAEGVGEAIKKFVSGNLMKIIGTLEFEDIKTLASMILNEGCKRFVDGRESPCDWELLSSFVSNDSTVFKLLKECVFFCLGFSGPEMKPAN